MKVILTIFFVLLLVTILGCNKTIKLYIVKGELLNTQGKEVVIIKHEEIPGFMDAMTMPFELDKPGMAGNLEKGDKVKFALQKKDYGWRIVEIHKIP